MNEINRDIAAKRRKDRHGLTTRERQVLKLRVSTAMSWAEISRLLGVSKYRITEVKKNLTVKGMLTDDGQVSEIGKEVV